MLFTRKDRLAKSGPESIRVYVLNFFGVVVKRQSKDEWGSSFEFLPGRISWSKKIAKQGDQVIILCEMPGSFMWQVEQFLLTNGFIYSKLVMDVGSGEKFIVNDKHKNVDTAIGVNLETDSIERWF